MAQTRKQTRCPSGTIYRKSYSRKTRSGRRISVKGNCITDVGAPGKGLRSGGPGIGPLRVGDLSQFGYEHVTDISVGRRHLALGRAVTVFGALSVFRKLNAVYVYTRRTSPSSSRVFKADRDWVKTHYGV
jgi:hypothetical protein